MTQTDPAPDADIVNRLERPMADFPANWPIANRERAEAAATIRALRAERVPEGWREALSGLMEIVNPPTPGSLGEDYMNERIRRARAMLDAAPEPPAPAEAPSPTDDCNYCGGYGDIGGNTCCYCRGTGASDKVEAKS